jgi:cyclopropane-fatty-acyl-phospholipid synthase
MIGSRVPSSTPARAASILREVFGGGRATGFAVRLWDGTDVVFGDGPPRFTVVMQTPQTFVRLMRDPSPRNFAEAFVEGAIDIEGDLFAAMEVANVVEDLKVPLRVRLRVLGALWAA